MQISVHDVKEGILNLRTTGGHRLHVTRPTRTQAKIENPNGKGMLPMGDTIKGNRFNFGIYPAASENGDRITLAAFEWPQAIPITKTVEYKGKTHQYKTMINYAIGGDSLIDRAATIKAGGEVKLIICGAKKGCKRLMSVCGGECAIRRQANHQRQVEAAKRAREAATAEQRKQARVAAQAEKQREFNSNVRVAHYAAFGPRRDPTINDQCPHLAKGKCARGKTCRFSHEHLSEEAIRAITCQIVVRRPKGPCAAGIHCVYNHPNAEPESMICEATAPEEK